MQISINIKDETELKAQIREMVAGYIKQMAREEAEKILKDELNRLLTVYLADYTKKSYNLDSRAEAELNSIINAKVKVELGTHPFARILKNEHTIKDMLSDKINASLKEMKFETMVKVAVEDAKRDAIKKLLGEK